MRWKCYCQKTATPGALLTTILMMSTNQGTQQPWYVHVSPPPPQKKKKTKQKKQKIRLVLPYLGLQSKIIIKQLKACINIFYGCIDLRVIFPKHTSYQVSFPLQRQAQQFSNVQRANCWDCHDFYIGKTKRRLHDRKLNTSRQSSAHHQSTFPKLATKSTRF